MLSMRNILPITKRLSDILDSLNECVKIFANHDAQRIRIEQIEVNEKVMGPQ
jgi:hypothetical protein